MREELPIRAELLIARSKVRAYQVGGLKLPINMEELEQLAVRYFEKTNSKKIVMESNDLSSYYVIDYISRFSPRYTKFVRKRFSTYFPTLEKYKHCKNIFLTLTVDPKRCYSLAHAKTVLQKEWGRLTNFIRASFRRMTQQTKTKQKKRKKIHRDPTFTSLELMPAFIKTFEFQKSGLIHLHGLLLNVAFLPHQTVEAFSSGRNRIEIIRHGLRAAMRYIYKYIIKNHRYEGKYDEGKMIFNDHVILAWALGLRTFSISLSNKGISHQQEESGAPSRLTTSGQAVSGDYKGNALSKPTYHKLMVIGDLPSDIVGYFTRGSLVGLLSEIEDRGGSNLK